MKRSYRWHSDPKAEAAIDYLLGMGFTPNEYENCFLKMIDTLTRVVAFMEPYAKENPEITLEQAMALELKRPMRPKHRTTGVKKEKAGKKAAK